MTADSSTRAAIATNRFGLGARPGELDSVAGDPRGWLLEQLRAPYRPPAELGGLASSREVLAGFFAAREQRDEARKRAASRSGNDPAQPPPDPVGERIRPYYVAQAAARAQAAITSSASFRERLVQFWSNHFAVSVDKPICLGTAGTLENEAIRPRITGRFADLLLAVEMHPAMITYLDNQQSVGPNSEFARRVAGRRGGAFGAPKNKIGLNENLAREILELHTLGVDGGYTQADVTTFAGVITGWSVGGGKGRLAEGEPGTALFRSRRARTRREDRARAALPGRRFRAGSRRAQGPGRPSLDGTAPGHEAGAAFHRRRAARRRWSSASRAPTRPATVTWRASTRRCSAGTMPGRPSRASSRRRATSSIPRCARSTSIRAIRRSCWRRSRCSASAISIRARRPAGRTGRPTGMARMR